MTDYVALTTLRTLARQRADMENSQFVSANEWREYINRGYAELYDLLTTSASSEDYFLNSNTFSLVSGTKTYDLPSDFYKMRGVDLISGSDSIPLRRYNFSQRNVGSRYAVARYLRYHLQGSQVSFNPKPSTTDSVKLWYVPSPKKFIENTPTAITRGTTTMWTVGSNHKFVVGDLVTGVGFTASDYSVDQEITAVGAATITTDLNSAGLADPVIYGSVETRLDFYSGWDEYVICATAIDALTKEESDITAVMGQLERVRARILAVAELRDVGEPVTVTDVGTYYSDFAYRVA